MNLIELASMSDEQAREYLEKIRWPNGPICPHCNSDDCTRLQGEAHRLGTIQCNNCRGQFTVTVGSVMESSHVPLVKWCMAFHLLCSSKKGFSAKQLQRELGLGSYRTAWFMMHRVRHAMNGQPMERPLQGEVEVDETYVGGKPRFKGKGKRGRGTEKAPIVALVERDGAARCVHVKNVSADSLHTEILSTVAENSVIMTDEFNAYSGIGQHFRHGHETINHKERQYVRRSKEGRKVTTNTAESFFALIKRGHYGVYHQMSKTHLHRYCNEFAFRWSYRKVSDSVRTEAALSAAEGKRLLYETPAR